MKSWYVLLLAFISINAMHFDIEKQRFYLMHRTQVQCTEDHVIIQLPLKECAICFEDKHLVGSVPCKQGDKHPEICDDCMHEIIEKKHVSKGTCPFCRSNLDLSDNLACSICKEKFKTTKSSFKGGCSTCFIVIYKKIQLLFD